MNHGNSAPAVYRRLPLPDILAQDLHFAARGLARNPGFAAMALVTLALGIGASAAMFSVMRSVLLRSPPFAEPNRLVALRSVPHRAGSPSVPTGYADVARWRDARSVRGFACYDGTSVVIQDNVGAARRVSAVHMSAELFNVLGTPPVLGRGFTDEEVERREPLAVLSHDHWLQQYGGSTTVLDESIIIDGRSHRIIGVAAPATRAFDDAVLWLPATLVPGWDEGRDQHGPGAWRVIARLAPDATVESAQAEFSGIAARLERDFPASNSGVSVRVATLAEMRTTPQLRLALLALAGAVGAVLLIACSNVSSLLLARGATRQREFAVRAALGASRRRLIVQLLLENGLLALLAAAAGTGLAAAALKVLRSAGPASLPRLGEVALDGPALAFATGLALVSAVLSGLFPALRSTSRDPMAVLRGGRGSVDSRPARRLRAGLVVAESALAVVLLAAALLLTRSLARLTAVDSGFRSERALLIGLNFPRERPAEDVPSFVSRMIERVHALPGVRAAGISEEVLLGDPGVQELTAEGGTATPEATLRLPLRIDAVSEGYLAAVGVPLRAGRWFTAADDAHAPKVAVINETLARRLWPDLDPIGRRLREGGPGDDVPWITVVGVVADLLRQGPDRAPIAQCFRPLAQRTTRSMILVVATETEPGSLAPVVRAAITEVDRTVPVSSAATLRDMLDEQLTPRRFILGLIGAFAASSLGLAGIGIFGLMNYSVSRRIQEIGVRMALGARPADVLRMVFGEGLRLVGVGIALGLGLSALMLPALSGLLFEVEAADPVSLAASVVLLIVVAMLACWIPASRAVSVDPVTALRAD
jgi:putative ABC transport system permease protein